MSVASRQVRRAMEREKRDRNCVVRQAVSAASNESEPQSRQASSIRWWLVWIGSCILAGGVLGTTVGFVFFRSNSKSSTQPVSFESVSTDGWPTLESLAAMSDAELGKVDPIVVNLVVARGITGWEKLDIKKYVKQVDEWAAKINEASNIAEQYERDTELYKHSPKLWRAGGMAIALAGSLGHIHYTTENLSPAHPEQSFVNGLIDTQRGTCASMPILFLGVAHRLGWPMHAVVSRDHMWTRWDEGEPGPNDGKEYFNLEATDAASKDGMGKFSSPSDEEMAKFVGTPRELIDNGSDFGSLTPRQTLAVYLQARVAYWQATGKHVNAIKDAKLAVSLFPKNYDIAMQAQYVMQGGGNAGRSWGAGLRQPYEDDFQRVIRINQENRRRAQPPEQPQQPSGVGGDPNVMPSYPGQPSIPGQPQNPAPYEPYNPFPGSTP